MLWNSFDVDAETGHPQLLLLACRTLIMAVVESTAEEPAEHKIRIARKGTADFVFPRFQAVRSSTAPSLNHAGDAYSLCLWASAEDNGSSATKSISYSAKSLELFSSSGWNSLIRATAKDISTLEDSWGDFSVSQLFLTSLWSSGLDSTAIVNSLFFAQMKFDTYSSKHAAWRFWNDWYLRFYAGEPLDWNLQRRVALIADPIWDAGPEAVAAEIERIKAEMLSEQLPMAETIELNPETGKFRAIPTLVENAPYMSALLSQIEDALEDCLGGHNGLSERAGDVKKLNRVLTKYRDDPQNAELTLTRVAGSLRAQLHESRELPDNEDNLALLNAVEEGVRGIRANHPEVAANREQLAQQAMKALAPADKQVLEEALPVLAAISEPELADDFAQDIPELINDARLPLPDGAPLLPGADAATRIFSRSSKMAPLWEKLNAAHDGKVHRIATMGLAAYAVSELLVKLVSLGLRLLGVL